MIEDRSILLQLWSGFALPTPQQNRKARVQCNPAGKPLKFRGALSKQAEPALDVGARRVGYPPSAIDTETAERTSAARRDLGTLTRLTDVILLPGAAVRAMARHGSQERRTSYSRRRGLGLKRVIPVL